LPRAPLAAASSALPARARRAYVSAARACARLTLHLLHRRTMRAAALSAVVLLAASCAAYTDPYEGARLRSGRHADAGPLTR
jgi:hypothetical protein